MPRKFMAAVKFMIRVLMLIDDAHHRIPNVAKCSWSNMLV